MTMEKARKQGDNMIADTYKSPFKLANEQSELHRREREDYQKVRADIITQVIFDFPKASKEHIEAIAFRRMNEAKVFESKKTTVNSDPECTLKPDLSKTIKHHKVRKYYHNGKWEINKNEGIECWSCCVNADKDSEGCVANVIDKHRWILSTC
jgi:hypothetical protein